jgi:hypothetical protein
MLLTALEKHVPSARALLEEVLEEEELSWKEVSLESCEFLCVYGVSAQGYEQVRPWLDEESIRRLVFIEDKISCLAALLKEKDAPLLLNDRRVKIHFLETPLQIEPAAKKTAWEAVFRKFLFVDLRGTENSVRFGQILEAAHLAAGLLLSDASDWQVSVLKNSKRNNRPFRDGFALKEKFKGSPAVIVGAGPSLRKNGHLLRLLENKALIFAGGAALNSLKIEPHFAASIDKEAPCRQFKTYPFAETPFLYQNRMNPENNALIHGEALLFPDSSSEAINWIFDLSDSFDGGWTVGNFLTAAALHLGCGPIIFIGMDFCYQEGDKYACVDAPIPEGLISTQDKNGTSVWTQRDWAMAARWMEEWARSHPNTQFIDATEGGLGFKEPIVSSLFSDAIERFVSLPKDLRGLVHTAIQALPVHSTCGRWRQWEESLRRAENVLAKFQLDSLCEEVSYQKLLAPLWNVWRPVFDRELDLDLQPFSREEKLKLHQILFFQQVVQEHLYG